MRRLSRWDVIAALKLRLADMESLAKDTKQPGKLRMLAVQEIDALRPALRKAELEGLLETLPTAYDDLLRLPSLSR